MIRVVLISFTILIFPIFINFDVLLKKDLKRVFYGVHAYGIIPLSGGYMETGDKTLIIHLSNHRAIIIPFNKILGIKNKIKPLKDYHFIKLEYVLDIGCKNGSMLPFSAGCAINYVTDMLKRYFYFNKPYLKLNGKVNIYMGKNIFDVYFSGIVVFNILMIVLSIIKILTEKLFYAFGKRKEQN